jgi:hypothetical protein
MQKVLLLFLIVSFLFFYACPNTNRQPEKSQPVVYLAGECYYTDIDYFPCYWNGTIPTPLDVTDGCTAGSAYSITVAGNTVYTAGRCHNFVNTVACY